MMKKLLLLFFLLTFIKIEAQQLGIEKSDIRRGFFVALSGGLTSPTGDYKTYADAVTNADGQVIFGATEKITGTSQFNLDAGYQFGAFGIGVSIGSFTHKLDDLSFQSDLFNADFPILKSGGAIDGTYYGTGPDYTFSFGKFSTTTSARIGLMNFSTDTFTGSYNGTDTSVPLEVIKTELASDGNTSLGYTSIGLKLSYDISKQLSLFTKTDYFIALGDGLKVKDNGIVLNDINKDHLITAADFDLAVERPRFENERTTKPKMVNVGFGLTYNFKLTQKRSDNTSKLPIREGGRTVEAGQVPEKTASNGSDDMGDEQNDTKRAADLKKLADELVNAFAIDDVIWSSNINHNIEMLPRDIDKPFLVTKDELVDAISNEAKLTKVDAGNALNALYANLSTLLNNKESLQLIHFEENKNTSEASNARVADLKKLADELVNLIADEAKLTKADAGNALNAISKNLYKTLKEQQMMSPESSTKLIVPVALNKGLRFEIDKDLSNNELDYAVLSVKADDKDLDSDGYGDAARGIEKSDIRRGMVIAKPSPSRVATNNPNTEDNTKRATGDLKNIYPPGSKTKPSRFGSFDDIEYFAWEYIGEDIPNANYIIHIRKIGDNGQAQKIFIGQIAENTPKNQPNGEEISSANKKVAKFKAGKALADTVKRSGNSNQGENGEYQWTVTETTTGISSEPGFFTISKKLGDVHGYDENSAMLVVKIDQSALRNTNTVMNPENESLSGKRDERMKIRALRIHDARQGFRAKRHDERIKTVRDNGARMKTANNNDARIKNARTNDARMKNARDNGARMKNARTNDARMKTANNNDARIKNARTNDARMKTARDNDARMKNARIKDARMGAKADKRYEDAIRKSTEPTNKPTEIITDEDFKMAPQTDIDTRYLRIKNHQNVQIPKGSLQLIAPLLSVQNVNDPLVYAWTVTNKKENIEESFIGNSIHYNFNNAGTYNIKITPMLNGQKLQPYQILIIIN